MAEVKIVGGESRGEHMRCLETIVNQRKMLLARVI